MKAPTVALGSIAGPRAIPFGTRVRVGDLGIFVVRDRLARRYDSRWDIFFMRHGDAKKFGKQTLDVTVIP